MTVSRRSFLRWAAASSVLAWAGHSTAAQVGRSVAQGEEDFAVAELELPGFAEPHHGIEHRDRSGHALVLVPRHLDPGEQHPGVVLLHGYMRSFRGRSRMFAWRDAYGLAQAYAGLREASAESPSFGGRYLTASRKAELSQHLADQPFRGLLLICPVVPAPYLVADRAALYTSYSEWLTEVLLPAVREATPLSKGSASVGLAGVSMGGRMALEVFVRAKESFGALSLMQPELRVTTARSHADRLADALGASPLRIVTSKHDPYRSAVEAFANELAARSIEPNLSVVRGPHTADWMREVGTPETLLFHDRVLSRMAG